MILFKQKNNIDTVTKASCFLIMLWITYTPDVIGTTLSTNFSIPIMPFQKVIFVLFPISTAMMQIMKRKRIYLPHLLIYAIMLLSFLIIEYYHAGGLKGAGLDFWSRWVWIYLFFIILVNINPRGYDYSFLIEYFIVGVMISNLLLVAGMVGLIKFPLFVEEETGRILGAYNLNTYADLAAMGILVLLILKSVSQYKNIIKRKNINLIIIMFVLVPIMTASRGAVVIILLLLVLYNIQMFLGVGTINKIVIFIIITGIILFVQGIAVQLFDNLLVVQRLRGIDYYSQGRGMQIIAAWYNFLASPWFGVGYAEAAAGTFSGITRSNFLYLQIMAGSGILFTLLFIIFNYKIFIIKISNITNIVYTLILIFIAVKYSFRRPDYSFAFLMYIASVYDKKEYK